MMLVLSSSMGLHAICRVTFAEYTSKSERVMSNKSKTIINEEEEDEKEVERGRMIMTYVYSA